MQLLLRVLRLLRLFLLLRRLLWLLWLPNVLLQVTLTLIRQNTRIGVEVAGIGGPVLIPLRVLRVLRLRLSLRRPLWLLWRPNVLLQVMSILIHLTPKGRRKVGKCGPLLLPLRVLRLLRLRLLSLLRLLPRRSLWLLWLPNVPP